MKRANDSQENKIPVNDPSKAMDSKKEVEQSPDEKTDQDFPGYPHYPAKEDIMDKRTDSHRVDVDVENISNTRNVTGVSQRFENERGRKNDESASGTNPSDDFSDIGPRTEITNDGLDTLGSRNAEIGIPQNADNDDLNKRTAGTDLSDDDTDMDFRPGTEADVTPEERMALENVSMPSNDENNLRRAALDNTDFDGDELNEDSFGEVLSSTDLDIPDEVDETESTAMGQGDEENKYYSLGGDRQDRNEEDPYSGPNRGDEA